MTNDEKVKTSGHLGEGPQRDCLQRIGRTLCFDVTAATGKNAQHCPSALKTNTYLGSESVVESVEHLLTVTSDEWTHPGSSGVWGWKAVCDLLGMSPKTLARRREDAQFSYIVWVGSGTNAFPVSNVNSLAHHGNLWEADSRKYRPRKLR